MNGHRLLLRVAISLLLAGLPLANTLWAMDRSLRATAKNYPDAPVQIARTNAKLVETYTAPTQVALPGGSVRTTRVRYANRAGQAPSVFLLSGEALCHNRAGKAIEAIEVAIVMLDAFHQPLPAANGRLPYLIQQVLKPIAIGGSHHLAWEERVDAVDVYEVAVVVTRVRFVDGSVWAAPDEELVDIF